MYPNYCFRKPPTDHNYDVMFVPKSCSENHSHLHSHARSRSHTRQMRQPAKQCCDDRMSVQALRERNEQLRQSHSLKSQTRTSARSVEFRLPSMEQKRYRENAGLEPINHEYNQNQQQQQQQASAPRELPSSAADTNREIQDSCTDFFNIIYENVLEAVHGAVEHMVSKHFEQLLCRIDQLAADQTDQEALIKQVSTDVMGKLSEQNETSINQFKFIAQMLIDNQTIFYRALSTHRRPKHQIKEEREDILEQNITCSAERPQRQRQEVTTPNQLEPPRQHQLWQQQDERIFPQPPFCSSCSHKSMRPDHPEHSRPPTIVRRSAKGVSTASMPDLHRSTLFPASRTVNSTSKGQLSQRTGTPTPWTQSDTARKCRCFCSSARERSASPRRRLRNPSKV